MMETITKCNLCELCSRNKPINGIGNENADIMFIFSKPSYYTIRDTKLTNYDISYSFISKLLKMINMDINDVYITHAVKGRSVSIKKKNIIACKPYLQDELNSVKPRIIVPMGTQAVQLITKRNYPINAYTNKALLSKNKVFILPMFNMAYIAGDVRYHGLALRDFVNLYKLYIKFINPNLKQFEENLHPAIVKLLNK